MRRLILALGCLYVSSAFGQILRHEDGTIKIMDQYQAMTACPKGTHLPTIRELARDFQQRGANGIAELSEINPKHLPRGYRKISVINPDGKADEFFFSEEGYRNSDPGLNGIAFWSSSIALYSYFTQPAAYNSLAAYYMTSEADAGDYNRKLNSFAVRCFLNR